MEDNKKVTIEDIREWKKQLDDKAAPSREFKIFVWCENEEEYDKVVENFNKRLAKYAKEKLK